MCVCFVCVCFVCVCVCVSCVCVSCVCVCVVCLSVSSVCLPVRVWSHWCSWFRSHAHPRLRWNSCELQLEQRSLLNPSQALSRRDACSLKLCCIHWVGQVLLLNKPAHRGLYSLHSLHSLHSLCSLHSLPFTHTHLAHSHSPSTLPLTFTHSLHFFSSFFFFQWRIAPLQNCCGVLPHFLDLLSKSGRSG